VTAKDYEVLPQLINDGGKLEAAGKAKMTGNSLVKRRLSRGGEAYEAVFELRRGRKMLALQSFYIIEGAAEK
jgi:hypothetical protein